MNFDHGRFDANKVAASIRPLTWQPIVPLRVMDGSIMEFKGARARVDLATSFFRACPMKGKVMLPLHVLRKIARPRRDEIAFVALEALAVN